MLKLVVAAVAALVIGFTVRDMTSTSGPGPEEAWAARADEVETYLSVTDQTGDAHGTLSETGAEIKDWLLERVSQPTR